MAKKSNFKGKGLRLGDVETDSAEEHDEVPVLSTTEDTISRGNALERKSTGVRTLGGLSDKRSAVRKADRM